LGEAARSRPLTIGCGSVCRLKPTGARAEALGVGFAPRTSARTRRNGVLGTSALLAVVLALCVLAGTAAALSPLPRSDYTVRPACAAPSPGRASCLALQLVPRSREARAHTHPLGVGSPTARRASSASEGAFGLTPSDLHTAYRLPTTTSGEQTIALVDAYNSLTAESDLKAYDEALGLPPCTTANGCFKKVNRRGETGGSTLPFPKTSAELKAAEAGTAAQRERAAEAIGWGGEIALDIEIAHATCQNCKILLVEADTSAFEDLEAAEEAAELAAHQISNSWGGPEFGVTANTEAAGPFNHPGTVITASAGDYGYLEWASTEPSGEASFPASSPHVIAVGGTRLTLNASGHTWKSESVWNDGGGGEEGLKEGYGAGGGGCSLLQAPLWQRTVSDWASVGCGEARAVADIAAVADPYSGAAVYYASRECESTSEGHVVHWCTYGGTSLSSPIIAASYALAGGAPGVEYPASLLYTNATGRPASLHDVYSGSNGECLRPFDEATGLSGCTTREQGQICSLQAICLSRGGYDGPSGVGTPRGTAAFESSPGAETPTEEAEYRAEVEAREGLELSEAAARQAELERQEAEQRALAERQAAGGPAGTTAPALGTGSSTGSAPSTPSPAPPATAGVPPIPRIALLELTRKAASALHRSRPMISRIGFVFALNTPARIRVSLTMRHSSHGHTTWRTLRGAITLSATSGRSSARLPGHALLARGLYRLTLRPLGGPARSLLLHIR
jgi:hypothetical protein